MAAPIHRNSSQLTAGKPCTTATSIFYRLHIYNIYLSSEPETEQLLLFGWWVLMMWCKVRTGIWIILNAKRGGHIFFFFPLPVPCGSCHHGVVREVVVYFQFACGAFTSRDFFEPVSFHFSLFAFISPISMRLLFSLYIYVLLMAITGYIASQWKYTPWSPGRTRLPCGCANKLRSVMISVDCLRRTCNTKNTHNIIYRLKIPTTAISCAFVV